MRRTELASSARVPRRARGLSARARDRPLRPGELAWLVLELLAVAEQARDHGWCLGGVHPVNLDIADGGLERARQQSFRETLRAKSRARRHRRDGHDEWCARLGISRGHLWNLIRELRPADGGWLVLEAIEAAWGDLRLGAGSAHESPRECVAYRVRERITPVPWEGCSSGSSQKGIHERTARRAPQTHDAAHPGGGARHRSGAEKGAD